MDSNRFDRLERKIDKLTDAVTKIVRVEEQLISNNKRLDRVEERLAKAEDNLVCMTKQVNDNSAIGRFADKLFWVLFSAGVGLVTYVLK